MTSTRDAVIVDAIGSPMTKGKAVRNGKRGGALGDLHLAELHGHAEGRVDRNNFDPSKPMT